MSGQSYRHTQPGYLILIVMVVVALGIFIPAPRSVRVVTLVVGALLVICALLFSSLTVEVTDADLRFHFGPGFWRKQFALDDVTAANPTLTSWWEGWGIRITPRGMLYNVSGTNAVEIELRSGERLRIGTDEPETLVRAVRTALQSSARGSTKA